MISVGGYAAQDGDYELEISGGIFNCPIYAIARPGNNSGRYTAYYEGDVRVKITGGEFRGSTISTVQSEMASYIGGNYTLEITGGSFTALQSISAPRVRGTSPVKCRHAYIKAVRLRVVGISQSMTILPYRSTFPRATVLYLLAERKMATAAVRSRPCLRFRARRARLATAAGPSSCARRCVSRMRRCPAIDGDLTVTSVYGGVDFREANGAEIELAGAITLGSETLFEHVDFESRSNAAYIFCGGSTVTFGLDIHCTTNMDGGVSEYIGIYTGSRLQSSSSSTLGVAPTNLVIQSGAWEFVRGGNERAQGGSATLRTVIGNSVISIHGGSFYDNVCGTGKNSQNGNITLNISGGKFYGCIFGMSTPANVDNDMSTVTGNITLNISGGEFHGDIAVVQNPAKNTLNGSYTLNITGGDLRA